MSERLARPGLYTVLGVAYTVLAVAAVSRTVFQAATGAATGSAAVAVAFSGLAGVIYVIAAIGLRRGTARSVTVSRWCLVAELVGVGLVSVIEMWVGGFGRTAVWSGFGVGYGYLPILLPALGLWLTRRSATAPRGAAALVRTALQHSCGRPRAPARQRHR